MRFLSPIRPHASRLVSARVAILAMAALTPLATAAAQANLGNGRRQATRSELEVVARALESAASGAPDEKVRSKHLADANTVRQRLRNGDFIPGDRILLQVIGDTVLSDTFTVRQDRRLQLPSIPDISLHGVLDSELEPYLTQELSKYIRNAQVTATGLVRVAVNGAVGRPGFHTVPVDQALTDVLMGAGGPAGNAELRKSIVRRGNQVILDRDALQEAFRLGNTVGDVSMRDGDELFVPAAQPGGAGWQQIVTILGALTGVVFAIRYGFGG
jgi:protein involved in polysaccharide export with SLBB domain